MQNNRYTIEELAEILWICEDTLKKPAFTARQKAAKEVFIPMIQVLTEQLLEAYNEINVQ